jgi:hypothetical protein
MTPWYRGFSGSLFIGHFVQYRRFIPVNEHRNQAIVF